MYEIHIESEEFREKRTVQQHQMVNQVRGARHGVVCAHSVDSPALPLCVCTGPEHAQRRERSPLLPAARQGWAPCARAALWFRVSMVCAQRYLLCSHATHVAHACGAWPECRR